MPKPTRYLQEDEGEGDDMWGDDYGSPLDDDWGQYGDDSYGDYSAFGFDDEGY